mgnify:CR=1 FL=1
MLIMMGNLKRLRFLSVFKGIYVKVAMLLEGISLCYFDFY